LVRAGLVRPGWRQPAASALFYDARLGLGL